ncbi:MAG: hypothetical protein AB1716_15540 [Planctomycetota bacterium]
MAALLGASLGGCADLNYERVRLGQEQREYKSALPEDKVRRTTAGLCYLEETPVGRTDAIVVLLTRDRRVAGKLHAAHLERDLGLGRELGYRLHAELDPRLLDTAGAGAVDTLRVVADELTSSGDDTFTRTAHAWVAAGIIRILQQWPHSGDEGPAVTRVADALERVPAGGAARIGVDVRGVYVIEYTQGRAP